MTNQDMKNLDAWIARHVFNAHPDPETKGWVKEHTKDKVLNYELPNYTTDPAAAMMVLEKCHKKTDTLCGFHVEHKQHFVVGKSHNVEAETLPLAICLFAKKLFSKNNP